MIRFVALAGVILCGMSSLAAAELPAGAKALGLAPPPEGEFPRSIADAPCVEDEFIKFVDTFVWSCREIGTEKPWTSFFVMASDKPVSMAQQIEMAHQAMHERKILKYNEESFSPVTMPGSVGFRGIYQTDFGNRLIWSVYHNGKLYKAVVIITTQTDHRAIIHEVQEKFFGILEVTPAYPRQVTR